MPGLLQVLVRVNVPQRGPARFGEGDPLEPRAAGRARALRWPTATGCSGSRSRATSCAGPTTSATTWRRSRWSCSPGSTVGSSRRGPRGAGGAKSAPGWAAAPRAADDRREVRPPPSRRAEVRLGKASRRGRRHGGNARRTAELLRPSRWPPNPDKRPLHPIRRTIRYWASRPRRRRRHPRLAADSRRGLRAAPERARDLLLQPPVVVGPVRADGHPADAAAAVVLRPEGGGHGRRRSEPAHGSGPGRRSPTSPARTTCSRRPARSAP